MTALINLHDMISDAIERAFDSLLPLLARLVFAAVYPIELTHSSGIHQNH